MTITFTGINIHAKDPIKSFDFYKGLGLPVKEGVAPEPMFCGGREMKLTDPDGNQILFLD